MIAILLYFKFSVSAIWKQFISSYENQLHGIFRFTHQNWAFQLKIWFIKIEIFIIT